jgi:hypothetical protein
MTGNLRESRSPHQGTARGARCTVHKTRLRKFLGTHRDSAGVARRNEQRATRSGQSWRPRADEYERQAINLGALACYIVFVVEPLAELIALLRAVGPTGYVVVGGLAVRLLAGERKARLTRDIDLVAMDLGAKDRLVSHLRTSGYQIGVSGGWLRAAVPGAQRSIVDIAPHPVINPRTLEEMTLRESAAVQLVDGVSVPVAAPNDLALLKLAAHREQDIVDVMLWPNAGRQRQLRPAPSRTMSSGP